MAVNQDNFKDFTVCNKAKVRTSPNLQSKLETPKMKENAHMSFGNPVFRNSDALLKKNIDKKCSRGDMRSSRSSPNKKAVPGVINSLDDIELEFESEKEIFASFNKQNEQKTLSNPQNPPSSSPNKIKFVTYECSEQDNSYTREDSNLKAAAKPIKCLAEVAHFRGSGTESKLHQASAFNFTNVN